MVTRQVSSDNENVFTKVYDTCWITNNSFLDFLRTIMKKLLVLTPAVLALAACANNPFVGSDQTGATNQVVNSYEGNGKVTAAYAADGSAADLNITMPKFGISNQKVIMTQAVSGSGVRYVNNDNPKMNLQWQTKADYGVISAKLANGKEYSVNCTM